MKRLILYYLLTLLALSACSKKNETATAPLNETIPTPGSVTGNDTASVIFSGSFENGPYGMVTGTAKLVLQNGRYKLALQELNSSNGPDLHVYLAKEKQPVNFIDLGKLKSTAGNQLYDIAATPDTSIYRYALVHCQQYNHLFGSVLLK